MRLGAWLCASSALLFFGGCSGGYPLPPTPCDDWCDATKGAWNFDCEYNPASCVSQCETQDLDNPHCTNEFQTAISCYRNTPGATANTCDLSQSGQARPCTLEMQALATCAGSFLQGLPGPRL